MEDFFKKAHQDFGPIGQHKERAHGYFTFPKLNGQISNRMDFIGKEKIIWSLNNYLGLAAHPEIIHHDAEVFDRFGLTYSMGSRMMSGETGYHQQLEEKLSKFSEKEDALLLNFGYQGIMSIIDALCNRHNTVIYDKECHACIIDGLRLRA